LKGEGEKMKKLLILTIISLMLFSMFPILAPQVKGSTDVFEVVCVPWRGDENLPHPTYDGKEITLKGTVRYEGTINWEWDFGDGASQTGTATATDDYPYPISAKHTYHGAVGTIYVAKLTVTAGEETKSDIYLVRIEDETRITKADIAVDEGLWWLYQQQIRYTSGGVDFGYWQFDFTVAHTGAAVQAFENNGHKPFGDPTKDPYVDCVRRGLNYLTLNAYKVSIPADDGDTNGNGFGLTCHHPGYSGHEMYEIGMAMMAIVSSDTPGRVAVAGPDGVIGRTYQEIVQDMADFCAYAQNGPETGFFEGGWRYSRNFGNSDNSVTQWPIMGMVPAEAKWGITIANFVKPRLEGWLSRTQCECGGFGYHFPWDWVNIAKTAGTGIPGLLFCGVPETDPRVVNAINFIDTHWYEDNFGNGYAMYGVMKAFEEFLHRESTGSHLWWDEYVDYLIPLQYADGHWDTMEWSWSPELTTAWMVMILTKVVYDIPPTAIAKANGFDEIEVDKDQIITFDGSQSREGTYKIVKYEWDWESDGIYDAEGITATHSYSEYGTYIVTLRVTDNRDVITGGKKPAMTDIDTCIVHVHPPPHPPIADANGPYVGWIGVPVTLDGSGSWDPNEPPFGNDEIVDWLWDLDNDGEFDDASGKIVQYTWDEPGTYPIALWVRAKEEPKDCVEASRTIVTIGNHDPVADANGPYETWICHTITLDGSGSYDPDEPVGDRIVSYEWDLDNDGEYDDAFVVNPEFHREKEGVYIVRLRVTDSFGATHTDWTTVNVKKIEELACEISPTTAEVRIGESVTFTSSVSGGITPYSYQWYLNGNPVSGATSASWTFTPAKTGTYKVHLNVTDSLGNTAKSNEATVTVAPQLQVSISPMSASILVGQSVTFTSTVSGGYPPYSYQWFLNGNPVSGATSNTWTFTPTTSGIYYVYLKVTDDKGNIAQSDTARVAVATVPVGGYSISIKQPTNTKQITIFIATITILTATFTAIKRKIKRKH